MAKAFRSYMICSITGFHICNVDNARCGFGVANKATDGDSGHFCALQHSRKRLAIPQKR